MLIFVSDIMRKSRAERAKDMEKSKINKLSENGSTHSPNKSQIVNGAILNNDSSFKNEKKIKTMSSIRDGSPK